MLQFYSRVLGGCWPMPMVVTQIGESLVCGWQKRWQGSSHRGLGLAFTRGELCFDGWSDDFHDIEPSVGKRTPCSDAGKADQHVQARKILRCSCHGARAIPIFAREDFRGSLKNERPDESDRQTWCHCSLRYPLCWNRLLANVWDWNTCHMHRICHFVTGQVRQFYSRLTYS